MSGGERLPLAEAFRQAMNLLTRTAVAAMLVLWGDVDRRSMTWVSPGGRRESWLVPALDVLDEYSIQAHEIAMHYVQALRHDALGEYLPDELLPDRRAVPFEYVQRSLGYVGRGVDNDVASSHGLSLEDQQMLAELDEALAKIADDKSESLIIGRTIKVVNDAARETVVDMVNNDPRAIGYMRVTDGDPCYFCAMLASRGVVYSTKKSAQWKDGVEGEPYHPNCQCMPIPVYSDSDAIPQFSRDMQSLWNTKVQGRYSGRDARRMFRRAYKAWREQNVQATPE